MKEDPVTLEIFKHLYQAVAEEMGETLRRTGFSPNIKERRDYSCAVFDGDRKTIAQAEHMPVHLGSMPRSVEAAVKAFTFAPGDGVVLNDPYRGGTHLPDITLVQGVFCPGEGKPLFYVANRAHHADVGGMSPGSLPLASELYQEGIIIPPVRLMKEGELQEDVLALLLRNVRTPDERRGDLLAQLAANAVGARRLLKYVEDEGREKVLFYGKALQDYAERMTRALISELPDGHYHFEDYLDGDGRGREDVALRLTLTIQGDEAILDFRESDPQVEGSINAVRAITESASFYAFRAAIPEAIPSNEGGFRPLTILTRPGTILDALPPAAVSAGNVETSQRTVDVVLGALSQALPQRIPAAGQGTMNNITFGGKDRQGVPFAYYETLGGGSGAGPGWNGTSAVHVHMSNTLNTPIEALERGLPLRIESYAIRRRSGGEGKYRGGDGVIRRYRFLVPVQVAVISERRRRGPYGLRGGSSGQLGRVIRVGKDDRLEELPGKWQGELQAGEGLEIHTPGGGGWGER